ncbi:MAG: hypothetical protein ABIX01_13105 [Chitinophagaceae bacterium]
MFKLLALLLVTGVIHSCANQEVRKKDLENENVIVLKEVAINDSMKLFMYKLDGRSITADSYMSYQKEICDITRRNFIVSGIFGNFSVGENDTILIWSEYSNSIDSIKPSPFYFKKMKATERNQTIGFDESKKIYLNKICK